MGTFFKDDDFEFTMLLALGSTYHNGTDVGQCFSTLGCRLLLRALRLGDGTYHGGREAGLCDDQERRLPERRLYADDGAARRRVAPLACLLHSPLVRRPHREGAGTRRWGAGQTYRPPGRIAIVSDPQGAAFAIFEGETDD